MLVKKALIDFSDFNLKHENILGNGAISMTSSKLKKSPFVTSSRVLNFSKADRAFWTFQPPEIIAVG